MRRAVRRLRRPGSTRLRQRSDRVRFLILPATPFRRPRLRPIASGIGVDLREAPIRRVHRSQDCFAQLFCPDDIAHRRRGTDFIPQPHRIVAMPCGENCPCERLDGVLLHAPAIPEHEAERVLRCGQALLGSEAEPPRCLDIIRLDTMSEIVLVAEAGLLQGVPLLTGTAEPRSDRGLIRRNAAAPDMHIAQGELRFGMPLSGGQSKPSCGHMRIPRHTGARVEHSAQGNPGICDPLLRGHPSPLGSRLEVLRNAHAGVVDAAVSSLCPRVPLLRGTVEPFPGRPEILRNAVTAPVGRAQGVLCVRAPSLGQRADRFQVRLEVLRDQRFPLRPGFPCRGEGDAREQRESRAKEPRFHRASRNPEREVAHRETRHRLPTGLPAAAHQARSPTGRSPIPIVGSQLVTCRKTLPAGIRNNCSRFMPHSQMPSPKHGTGRNSLAHRFRRGELRPSLPGRVAFPDFAATIPSTHPILPHARRAGNASTIYPRAHEP